MTTSPTTTSSSSDLRASLELIEIKPGKRFSAAVLKQLLPDVETALFFGKVYGLDARQLGGLLHTVFNTDLTSALFGEGHLHSNELQDYLIGHWEPADYCDCGFEDGEDCECGTWVGGIVDPASYSEGDKAFSPDVPKGEILPEVWESLEVEVAASIQAVADKLESVVGLLPGKHAHMMFSSMAVLNKQRPVIGDYRAKIGHARQQENLLILDVSGSMTPGTVQRIIDDVVALSYKANAHLAIVSDTCTYWPAGGYGVDEVLAASQFSGTHYETLAPLFDRDWGVVITIADYDSSRSAAEVIAKCTGRIELVLDISLVNRPTYLAEVVGQLATEVRPLLIGSTNRVLT